MSQLRLSSAGNSGAEIQFFLIFVMIIYAHDYHDGQNYNEHGHEDTPALECIEQKNTEGECVSTWVSEWVTK